MRIYEPSGRAREYAPLACNVYRGCDHQCTYCYVRGINGQPARAEPCGEVADLAKQLSNEAFRRRATRWPVTLSFISDPYCARDAELHLTRQVLQVLFDAGCRVAILTKGGRRALADLDLLRQHPGAAVLGATLTRRQDADSLAVEPGAAPTSERIEALRAARAAGIRTWVSFEPVLDAEETCAMIAEAGSYADHIKIGRLNHVRSETDWPRFAAGARAAARASGATWYIKRDLWPHVPDPAPHELDGDHWQDWSNWKAQ